ncbi:DUF2845 domain-containing protein [Pseudomonas sp. GCM10022188]|uniref:DUF2845 domain-containing protein n=1 Tax=Pseudomonas TaxID=286 RepID=UPI001E46393F|nr:DUF2845 domain-containing protein [Pseudomonas oryzagri]MCC6074213.1 DUF2845 domain-containing protein [Pseudomonas oryzagri]
MSRFLCLALLLAATPLYAGSLRCQSQLVATGDRADEVLHKCGEPATRDHIGMRERTDAYGRFELVPVEEWSYGPRNGMYYFLRFEGNRLVEVDSQRRR